MGERRNSTGRVNQGDGPRGLEPRFVHAGGLTFAQVPEERLAPASYLTGAGQKLRDVSPAQNRSRKRPLESSFINGKPQFHESRDHLAHPVGSAVAQKLHGLDQSRIVISDKVPQDVKLTTFVFARQLDAVDQLDAPPGSLRTRNPHG